jgi:hypothetical protein
MEQAPKTSTRKKFLLWGAAILSSLTVFKFFSGGKTKRNEPGNATAKMLTRDGKLVEVNKKLLISSGNKISNEELQKWIKR